MKENIILGGGMAGLIFAYYNQDYKIITKEVGGQFKNPFPLGVRLLEDNKWSRGFLKEIGIPIKPKKAKVGYYYHNKIHQKPNKYFKKEYFEKSRGVVYQGQDNIMNNGKTLLKILEVNFGDILKILKRKLKDRIIYADVLAVSNNENKVYTDKGEFYFNEFVNTMPLNFFLRMLGRDPTYIMHETASVTFVLLKDSFFDLLDYNFVYFPNLQCFHRLSKTKKGIVAEIRGEKTEEELRRIYEDLYIDSHILKNSQIVWGESMEQITDKIKNFGRYGTFDRKYKTDTIIKVAQEWKKE